MRLFCPVCSLLHSTLLTEIVATCFHRRVLLLCLTTPTLQERVKGFFHTLFTASDAKRGVLTQVFETCGQLWFNPIEATALASLSMFQSELVSGCLLIAQPDRFERLVDQSLPIIRNTVSVMLGADVISRKQYDLEYDARIFRWHATRVLLSLNPEHGSQHDLAERIINELLARNAKLDLTVKTFHLNTIQHREKIRIWQCIVALSTFLTADTTLAEKMYPCMMAALDPDNQPSVRYYIEWVVARIATAVPRLTEPLLAILVLDECRPGVVVSTLTILVHVTLQLPRDDTVFPFSTFLSRLHAAVVPWLASTHATVRLYAAGLLQRVYGPTIIRDDIRARIPADMALSLQSCLRYFADRSDVKKHVDRLLNDFFFSRFDLQEDWTAEVRSHCLVIMKQSARVVQHLSGVFVRRLCMVCLLRSQCL
jgi:hypothetical protein